MKNFFEKQTDGYQMQHIKRKNMRKVSAHDVQKKIYPDGHAQWRE